MGAIDTILKLKALFMGLLSKAASAFTKILEDPIKFISNFMSAVKQGFMSFASNILDAPEEGSARLAVRSTGRAPASNSRTRSTSRAS